MAKTLGASLQYFQIGNEVDLFGSHLRDPKTWNAKAYLDEWLAMASAVASARAGSEVRHARRGRKYFLADRDRRRCGRRSRIRRTSPR